jgi:hypothetical protein
VMDAKFGSEGGWRFIDTSRLHGVGALEVY